MVEKPKAFLKKVSFFSVQTPPFDVQTYTFGQTLHSAWAQFEHPASFFPTP
jgi:hypothetical protein